MNQEHGVTIKRACQVARLSRAAYYRAEVSAEERDRPVIEALNEIVATRVRQLNAQVIDLIDHGFETLPYKSASCWDAMGFLTFRAESTPVCSALMVDKPVTGSAALSRIR